MWFLDLAIFTFIWDKEAKNKVEKYKIILEKIISQSWNEKNIWKSNPKYRKYWLVW